MGSQNKESRKEVIAHAPAKINLALLVEPLQANEKKHRLDSVFCTLALSDTLIFDFVAGREPFNARVSIESTDFNVSFIKETDNTLTKVVEHFKREYGFGFLPSGTLQVKLIKSIPTQAGLGGGSSDAAAMLRMLCWLAQVDPLSERSLNVARAVGADVPFFLHAPKAGLCAHMQGYGDTLVQSLPKPTLSLALVKPQRGVSTRKAFAAFDAQDHIHDDSEGLNELVLALSRGETPEHIASLCRNSLEPAAFELLPELRSIKQSLNKLPGVLKVTLCGSGSTLFALCADAEAARACMEWAASEGLWTVATQS